MGVKQSFFLALKSLATSKMRALLTMLGIIIGVAAVIIIISLGDGMQKLMSDSFDELGANLIQVTVQSSGSSREVDRKTPNTAPPSAPILRSLPPLPVPRATPSPPTAW